MPTPKLKPQDLEAIERQAQKNVNHEIFRYYFDYGLQSFAENVRVYVNAGDNEQEKKERSNKVKRSVIDCFLNEGTINYTKGVIAKIEPYFEGNQPGASGRARTLFRNFKYYNDMMFGAFEHFAEHMANSNNFFSADMYKM